MCIHSTLLNEDSCYFCVRIGTTIRDRVFLTENNTPLFPSEWTEDGHRKLWVDDASIPYDVRQIFLNSSARWLWFHKTYDYVFDEDSTDALAEEARRVKEERRRAFDISNGVGWSPTIFTRRNYQVPPASGEQEQSRSIWASIALGESTPQTKRAYQNPKSVLLLLHTIYSASKRITRDGETWNYVPWNGKSRLSDLASAEDRAQCHPAGLNITHVLGFSEIDQPIRKETADQRFLRQAAALASLPASPYVQSSEGFGHQFFAMPLDEGDEGELFLPAENRNVGHVEATLIFDPSNSTFYLQKFKQRKDATRVWRPVWKRKPEGLLWRTSYVIGRRKILGKERKQAVSKLKLFSLSQLKKEVEQHNTRHVTNSRKKEDKKSGRMSVAGELRSLWATALNLARTKNNAEKAKERCNRIFYHTDHKWTPTTAIQQLHDASKRPSKKGARTLSSNRKPKDSKLLQRFLDSARRFCKQQQLRCENAKLKKCKTKEKRERKRNEQTLQRKRMDFVKWITREHALQMAKVTGKVEPLKRKLIHKKRKTQELRTVVDRPREDDWENSEQQVLSSLSE